MADEILKIHMQPSMGGFCVCVCARTHMHMCAPNPYASSLEDNEVSRFQNLVEGIFLSSHTHTDRP